jgi:hypothetical protein
LGRRHVVHAAANDTVAKWPPRAPGQCEASKLSHAGGWKRSPDSESQPRELSKSGLGAHVGPQTCDFASRGGGPFPEVLPASRGTPGGTHGVPPGHPGAPTWYPGCPPGTPGGTPSTKTM